MSHNSNETVPAGWFEAQIESLAERRKIFRAASADAQPDIPFFLTGSQRKTAYALEKNVARLIEERGLNRIGFLTLTVGDTDSAGVRPFAQVWNAAEASRRINSLLTGFLRDTFGRMVIVTERHKSGAIHFHLLVECAEDIRTGLDFQAVANGDYSSANAYLRDLWAVLREQLPGYGFGRSELLPIKSNGEAVARYVSKYVEKNLFNRMKEDKGKKLVRYSGWRKTQMKPNEFSWFTPRAVAWRFLARKMASWVGVERREDVDKAFGPRWAFRLTRAMQAGEYIAEAGAGNLSRFEIRCSISDALHAECINPCWQWWEQEWERQDEILLAVVPEPSREIQREMFPERYKEAA